MKMFFTYFIAIILLGLCILEKESRNKEMESENNQENDIRFPAISSEMTANEIFLIPAGFQAGSNIIKNEGVNKNDFEQLILTDSLRSYFGTEKAQGKIF